MSPASQDYTTLFNRLLEGKLSPEDAETLIAWLGSEEPDPVAAELVSAQLNQPVALEQISQEVKTALQKRLKLILVRPAIRPVRRMAGLKNHWWRYAASIIVLFGIGIYILLVNKPSKKVAEDNPVSSTIDVAPGKTGAILTLADGRTVILDSLRNGLVATQNGTKVLLNNGQLVYDKNGLPDTGIAYNIMSTPKGRQFQLVLPDGSKVWLNAASSLHYPTTFTGKVRQVEVTGEAYFEVARNATMPFRVKVNDETEIEVLGTHFNINAYKNETTINTSLLEGSVRITNGHERVVLRPGQQAQAGQPFISPHNSMQGIRIVQDVDMEKVMAWKNGVFNFQDATLKEVMRQLERWYDIEVVYEKDVPQQEFVGKMGRDLSLANVLRGLEMNKVHFRIEEGRRVVVLP